VAAPGRFSTTKAWPSFSDSHPLISRAMMSGELAGGSPTMTRTGRDG